MAIAYQLVNASAVATYPATAQVTLGFEPTEYVLRPDLTNTVDVVLSFDGVNDHFVLPAPIAGANLPIEHLRVRYSRLWLKRSAVGTAILHVTGKTDT